MARGGRRAPRCCRPAPSGLRAAPARAGPDGGGLAARGPGADPADRSTRVASGHQRAGPEDARRRLCHRGAVRPRSAGRRRARPARSGRGSGPSSGQRRSRRGHYWGPPRCPADPAWSYCRLSQDAVQPDRVLPPDVVLAGADGVLPGARRDRPVASRARLPDPFPSAPIDERVLNPRGFVQRDTAGIPELSVQNGDVVEVRGDDLQLNFDARRGATAAAVQALRTCQAVRVAWPDRSHPRWRWSWPGWPPPASRSSADRSPAAYGDLLGARLVDALSQPVELDDPLRREEHSVRLRRAALLEHSGPAWRGELARRSGVPHRLFPSCSVLLATRRPQQLDFALRQFAQAARGRRRAGPGDARLRAGRGAGARRPSVTVRAPCCRCPRDALFGEVLNAGWRPPAGIS